MPLTAVKCPSCGAGIQIPSEREKSFCVFCGSPVITSEVIAPCTPIGAFVQRLKDAGIPMKLKPPASPETIARFEQEKKIRGTPQPKPFPDDYRELLTIANGGMFLNIKFFEISGEENSDSLAYQNGGNRDGVRGGLPMNLYIIADSAWEHPLAIDLDSQEIVQWIQIKKKEARRWGSMTEYLEEALRIHQKRMERINPTLRRVIDLDYKMKLWPPADEQDIAKFEQKNGIQLPAEHRALLLYANGFGFGYKSTIFGPYFFELSALAKNNTKKKYKIPDSMYIIGVTEYASICIDLNNQEIVEWGDEEKKETNRFATVFDYIDYEVGFHPQCAGFQDIIYHNENLIIIFNAGSFAGQTIHIWCDQLDNGHFIPLHILTRQISPVTREQVCSGYSYDDFKSISIRKLPEKEYDAILEILEVYGATPEGKKLGIEFL